MKELKLSTKEFMLLRELAIKYDYIFEHSYSNNVVTVKISEVFCDAFGF